MKTPAKKPKRTASRSDEPPYARYAFLNPYNLSLLIGTGVAAAATGHWWLALGGAATEALWMLFAPDSKALQRAWFDKVWAQSQNDDTADQRNAKLSQLSPVDQQRVIALSQQKEQILHLAHNNPSLTVDLMKEELSNLEAILDDFLDVAIVCNRGERHLATFDFHAMDMSWRMYTAQVQQLAEGDRRRAVAQKNVEVLDQRKKRWEELRAYVQAARGQMDLMENTFRLLSDEIVTMSAPEALGARLDDLRIGVDAIRETTLPDEELYEEALEEAEVKAHRR